MSIADQNRIGALEVKIERLQTDMSHLKALVERLAAQVQEIVNGENGRRPQVRR